MGPSIVDTFENMAPGTLIVRIVDGREFIKCKPEDARHVGLMDVFDCAEGVIVHGSELCDFCAGLEGFLREYRIDTDWHNWRR